MDDPICIHDALYAKVHEMRPDRTFETTKGARGVLEDKGAWENRLPNPSAASSSAGAVNAVGSSTTVTPRLENDLNPDVFEGKESWFEYSKTHKYVCHVFTPTGSHCAFFDGGTFGFYEYIDGVPCLRNWAEETAVRWSKTLLEEKTSGEGETDGGEQERIVD